MKSLIPIRIPDKAKKGQPVTADWANQIREALQRLANRNVSDSARAKSKDTLPPFWPKISKEEDAWKISLTQGYVYEREPYEDTQIRYFLPTNISESLEIEDGEAIYVSVPVLETGEIDATRDLELEVKPDDSTTPIEFDAENIRYYYHIAKVAITDGVPTITRKLAGSHIRHVCGGDLDVHIVPVVEDTNGVRVEYPENERILIFRGGIFMKVLEHADTIPESLTKDEQTIYSWTS